MKSLGLILESESIMELCGDCRIGVMTISDNNIYYVDKFCNDCFKFNTLFKIVPLINQLRKSSE